MRHSEALRQQTLFEITVPERVVNVASVPHRSPFRYPGGKTWLIPRIRTWLASQSQRPELFIEPFTGGGIVGLTVAFEDLADRVLLVELDENVAAVWLTMLSQDNNWLAERVLSFDLTEEHVLEELAAPPKNTRERAFKTILKNRTFHGGILAAGSAPIRSGENGKGIRSRWYAETLARRIRDIALVSNKIEFTCADGIQIIERNSHQARAAIFIDPPYTAAGKKAGKRLYSHHFLDHERLFAVTHNCQGDFLMTYDNADDVVQMAERHGFQTRTIAMKNTHHAVMKELLIGRDVGWVS